MDDKTHDAIGLLAKLRERAAGSGANRGLQAVAANTAIEALRELAAERDALRAELKRAQDYFRLALAVLEEQTSKIEALREAALQEQKP